MMKEFAMDDLTEAARLWGIEPGYHDVFGHWHEASAETLSRLIAAISHGRALPSRGDEPVFSAEPRRAFQGDGRRLWGLSVQLYAVRSRRNWGHGDFTDLARIVALAGSCGAGAVGLNPLHALFPDRAEQASPYAPNSRLFLNPLYIDVEAIPEFAGTKVATLESDLAALRRAETIDYAGVGRAKLAGLHLAFRHFQAKASAERRADFEMYRCEQGEALLRFACFECLRTIYAPKPWPEWPAPWRNPDRPTLEDFWRMNRAEVEFHEYVQWNADRQLRACKDATHVHGMPIGLYVDLAVGIDPSGADAWSQQDAVLCGISIGAPPDELNTGGQNWGLAPFNPHTLVADDFAPMRQVMAAAMRHAGAIRLDHVLGLKRMFLIPQGSPEGEGAYVQFPFEPLLRTVAEESNRYRCIVIGEDLGTVPEGFRETLARWGLWTYRVMLFERDGEGRFRPPEGYPAEALATFNTHDLPSFQGWLLSHDLRVKRAIGLDPGETDEARAWAHQMLRAILAERGGGNGDDTLAAVASFLAATPSRLVVMSLEDILGEVEQINIPGTVDQHPNWRRKIPVLLEDLEGHGELLRVTRAFAKAGRSCSR
jgi:4-alpha-glucanotransferase